MNLFYVVGITTKDIFWHTFWRKFQRTTSCVEKWRKLRQKMAFFFKRRFIELAPEFTNEIKAEILTQKDRTENSKAFNNY